MFLAGRADYYARGLISSAPSMRSSSLISQAMSLLPAQVDASDIAQSWEEEIQKFLYDLPAELELWKSKYISV